MSAMLNVPNILSLSRIAIVPVLIALFFVPTPWAAWTCLLLYGIAAITDFLDGYLARWMNQMSAFGRFIDPISDKIFVVTILVLLIGFDRLPGLWMIPALLILIREFLIAGLREFLGPHRIVLHVSNLAKWKTTSQMIAIGFLIVGPYGETVLPYTLEIGQLGLLIAATLTVITGWQYTAEGLSHIRRMDAQNDL